MATSTWRWSLAPRWSGTVKPTSRSPVVLYAVLQQQEVLIKGRDLGLNEGDTGELLAPIAVQERFADKPDEFASAVAFFGLLVAFLVPQVFGQLAMLSVVEEKSTRVIEVLLSHLRPRTLLLGKVLGLSALAVVQLVVVVGGLAAALLLTNAIDIPASVWRFVPIVLVSILGGLAIYNTFFALLGVAHLPPGRCGASHLARFHPACGWLLRRASGGDR